MISAVGMGVSLSEKRGRNAVNKTAASSMSIMLVNVVLVAAGYKCRCYRCVAVPVFLRYRGEGGILFQVKENVPDVAL